MYSKHGRLLTCARLVQVLVEILSELDIGEFVVKLNHRRLLDAMMDLCGVPPSKFRAICRFCYLYSACPMTAMLCSSVSMNSVLGWTAVDICHYKWCQRLKSCAHLSA